MRPALASLVLAAALVAPGCVEVAVDEFLMVTLQGRVEGNHTHVENPAQPVCGRPPTVFAVDVAAREVVINGGGPGTGRAPTWEVIRRSRVAVFEAVTVAQAADPCEFAELNFTPAPRDRVPLRMVNPPVRYVANATLDGDALVLPNGTRIDPGQSLEVRVNEIHPCAGWCHVQAHHPDEPDHVSHDIIYTGNFTIANHGRWPAESVRFT